MTAYAWQALLPFCLLGGGAVVAAPLAAFSRRGAVAAIIAAAALALTIVACVAVASAAPQQVTPLFMVDRFARYGIALVSLCSLAIVLLSWNYFSRREAAHGEFFIGILLATFGAAAIVASSHFVSLFVGLEILNISLYVLIAWRRADASGIEAAIKYLIPGAVSGAFLLFGMALVYAQLGSMELSIVMSSLSAVGGASRTAMCGIALILAGVAFKLALAPFHLWTADVYEGAPLPAALPVATISKTALFILFVRYFMPVIARHGFITGAIAAMAIASMAAGNLLALRQQNLKRILAYSSIAHVGYFAAPILTGTLSGAGAAIYYLTAYVVTLVAAFGALLLVAKSGEVKTIADLRGLARRSPLSAAALCVAFGSLAGLPLTGGFFGKFYVLLALVNNRSWLLAVTLVLTSGMGLYYYLRVISAILEKSDGVAERAVGPYGGSALSKVAVSIAAVSIVVLGTFPAPLIGLIEGVVGK
jgi:NADH-quinone oxidoreductase subunit N